MSIMQIELNELRINVDIFFKCKCGKDISFYHIPLHFNHENNEEKGFNNPTLISCEHCKKRYKVSHGLTQFEGIDRLVIVDTDLKPDFESK